MVKEYELIELSDEEIQVIHSPRDGNTWGPNTIITHATRGVATLEDWGVKGFSIWHTKVGTYIELSFTRSEFLNMIAPLGFREGDVNSKCEDRSFYYSMLRKIVVANKAKFYPFLKALIDTRPETDWLRIIIETQKPR